MTLTLTMRRAPLINLTISRAIVLGTSGTGGITVTGETPTGAVNGSNATFTSLNPFVPGTVEVFVSGFRLTLLADYNTSGNNTITLFASPLAGELVRINYTRSL